MENLPFLKAILSQPTAPYREGHVIRAIQQELNLAGVPHFQDPSGNIVMGAASRAEYLKLVKTASKEPLRVFIAHMDHPGFHGVKWQTPTRLEVKWFGGTPTAFLEGAPVWVADRQGWVAEGHLVEATLMPHGKALASGIVELPMDDRRKSKAQALFGAFRFRDTHWLDGDLLYTKAADDLIGAFAICSLGLKHLGKRTKSKKKASAFLGILTRAEEVGFIGALAHLELGWLKKSKRPILCVSLETSRQLPGAEIGKGPVVRLGDRFTTFSPGEVRLFSELAQKALPGRHQRRVMDGGTCEGTAAMVYGHPVVAISVPLGNYHNQSFEGGPDSAGPLGPAPEFVHMQDVEGLLTLCQALLEPGHNWKTPYAPKLAELRASLKKAKALLASAP